MNLWSTLSTNLVISQERGKDNENDISPFMKPHLSSQVYYPSLYCHIYIDKSIGRVHKSEIFTMIHTTTFEMHKGSKSYQKYVVIGF